MWLYISHHKAKNIIPALSAVLLVVMVVLAIGVAGAPASAAAPDQTDRVNNSDAVQNKCREVTTKGARKACDDDKLIRQARNTASYHCVEITKVEDKQLKCVRDKAIEFIVEAATRDPKPETANGYKTRLTRILENDADETGGSLDEPHPSTGSLDPEVTCDPNNRVCSESIIDPALCAADPTIKGCNSNADELCTTNACDLVKKYVNPTIGMLSVAFGLIAVISLIMGSIQYSASAGDPQKVSAAKKRIVMTIMAIVAYAFLFGFLQFLIPGGIFNR